MRCFSFKTILFTTFAFIISCNNNSRLESKENGANKIVTLYNTVFLKGKVSSIVYNNEQGRDSTLFVYNNKQHLVKTIFHSNGKENGFCKYDYNASNRLDLHYYDNNQKETFYSIVEFDDNKNITLYREYGYIYPDTTKMVLLYMTQNSYDKDNRITDTFEYHCDGIPPYKYHYNYNDESIEVELCSLAATGDIYKITKKKKNRQGEIIELYENYPSDNSEWDSIFVEYKYDSHGNWIEQKITESSIPNAYNYSKRRIYYLEE